MSQVSNTLLRIGDQFRRGFESRGDAAMQGAEFGLKKAGLERQSRFDKLQLPALKQASDVAQYGLDRAEKLKTTPFNVWNTVKGIGSLEMLTGVNDKGVTGADELAQFAVGEGTKFDPNTGGFFKKDGSAVSELEAQELMPKIGQWYTLKYDPYKALVSKRDELVVSLKSLDPKDPKVPILTKQLEEIEAVRRSPEVHVKLYENLKNMAETIPDDPYGVKEKNIARINEQLSAAKEKYRAFIKRQEELSDIGTKHTQALELEGVKQTGLGDRSRLSRENTLEAARIRAGASENKFNKGEAEYQDELAKNKILGTFGLQVDMNGNPAGQVTKEQLYQMVNLGNQLGYEIQVAPGEKVDKPGLFTGDEQMFQIIGINRANIPGRQGYGLGGPQGQPGQPQPVNPPAAPLKQRVAPLSGPAAVKESKRLIQMIDAGSVNEKQLLDSLLASGQNEVVKNIVADLKAKRTTKQQAPGKPADINKLRAEEERRRIEQIKKEHEALKKPTDWGAVYQQTNRNVRR